MQTTRDHPPMNGISIIVPVHNNAAVALDTLTSVERCSPTFTNAILAIAICLATSLWSTTTRPTERTTSFPDSPSIGPTTPSLVRSRTCFTTGRSAGSSRAYGRRRKRSATLARRAIRSTGSTKVPRRVRSISGARVSKTQASGRAAIDFSSATSDFSSPPSKIERSRASVRPASSFLTCSSLLSSLIRSDLISRIVILSINSPVRSRPAPRVCGPGRYCSLQLRQNRKRGHSGFFAKKRDVPLFEFPR